MTETDVFSTLTSSADSTSTDTSADETGGENTTGDTTTGDSDTVVDTTATVFADDVRTNVPSEDAINETKRYEDPDGDGKADDTDARGLFRDPTLNEIRYYARQGPYGETIVTKPIEDVFKHGFTVRGDNTENEKGNSRVSEFLQEQYIHHYKLAEKKARRDGHCVLLHQISDSQRDVGEPIDRGTATFEGFHIYTVDNLTDDMGTARAAQYLDDYEDDQLYVTEGAENGGVVIVDDLSHPDHGSVVGYAVEPRQESTDVVSAQFVNAERCQHFVWNEHVDGNLGNNVTGRHVGESVLTSVLEPLKTAQISFWAMKNILLRYSAPLHAVEPPESWGMDDWEAAEANLENLSAASDGILPPGSSLEVADGVSEFDPEPFHDTLVKAMCGGTIFTKSVLEGTQAGTVSGSETDVKGYFNGVHILRTERTEEKFREVLRQVSRYDQSTIPRVADIDNIDFEWGPLFKPTDLEQAEGMVSVVTAATNAIKNYVLTPEEARDLLEVEWSTFDVDISLDELTEADRDALDRINMNEAGQGQNDNEPDVRGSQMRQNGGGQPKGQGRNSSQPNR